MAEDIVPAGPDGGALIRPGRLLIEESGLAAAERWGEEVARDGGICEVRLAPGVDPWELAVELRAAGHRASPNHVFVGQPLYWGGPASRPFPAPPPGSPPDAPDSGVTVAILDTGIVPHPWWATASWFTALPPSAHETSAPAGGPLPLPRASEPPPAGECGDTPPGRIPVPDGLPPATGPAQSHDGLPAGTPPGSPTVHGIPADTSPGKGLFSHDAPGGLLAPAEAGGGTAPQAGHGTFVTGLVVRGAPGVRPRVMKVLDARGVGDEATLLSALARLRRNPPHLLNLSLGGHTPDDEPSPLLADAIAALSRTVVVACAGNTASTRPMWPAALPGVIAVSALDVTEEHPAPFTAFGPWVDACARGEWLTSTFLTTAEFPGYAHWSGTSFATAVVTAAIADAARNLPPRAAAAHVLDPAHHRTLPGLGVHVPVPP